MLFKNIEKDQADQGIMYLLNICILKRKNKFVDISRKLYLQNKSQRLSYFTIYMLNLALGMT